VDDIQTKLNQNKDPRLFGLKKMQKLQQNNLHLIKSKNMEVLFWISFHVY